ncbi:hypothetical protein [Massilia sp. TWP1-3-3]|uniref:hypothetical protein n=1 Tax=Massilia sp. TWP1-3-3 TaxID=2804573 RepID=UPI003CE9B9F0
MRTPFLKLTAICALLIAAGCQTTGTSTSGNAQQETPPPKNPAFATEMSKFDAQFPSAKASKYENESLAFNNAQKLDEKGNCHGKSMYPVTIVLVLDPSGRVASSTTDVENGKAACFRAAYAGVQFPKPPMAGYRKPILLK